MNNKEKLNQFLNLFNGSSKVLVVINADPDSIASAMAVKRLLWRKVSEVCIAYFNKISRPDNLAMIEYTESGLVLLDDIKRKILINLSWWTPSLIIMIGFLNLAMMPLSITIH